MPLVLVHLLEKLYMTQLAIADVWPLDLTLFMQDVGGSGRTVRLLDGWIDGSTLCQRSNRIVNKF